MAPAHHGKKSQYAVASEKSSGTANLNMRAGSLNPQMHQSPPQYSYPHSQQASIPSTRTGAKNSTRHQQPPQVHAHQQQQQQQHQIPHQQQHQQNQPQHQQYPPGHHSLAQGVATARNPNPGPDGSPGSRSARVQGPPDPSTNLQHRTAQPYPNVAPLHHVSQQTQARTLSGSQSSQQPYPSPNIYTPQPSLQSPFLNNQAQFQAQQASTETPNFYPPTQSPRSQHSGAGTFFPAEKSDSMAATATMQRPYPPIYHTPQSNSPASVTSPQTHDPARPMYGQPGSQMSQPIYGYQYPMNTVQPTYGQHHPQSQQHQMNPQSMLSYQSGNPQISQSQVNSHHSAVSNSPRLKGEANQHYQLKSEQSQLKYEQSQPYQQSAQSRPGMMQQQQTHPSSLSQPSPLQQQQQQTQPQQASQVQQHQQQMQQGQQQQQQQQNPNLPPNSNAAPGPIPATTPLVVRQDGNGVQWIAFEYSRDRVKMEYTIRCDVESVDANALPQEFKAENCVYPRACVPKDMYKGNRMGYETDCNQVGWALAQLNPCLRGKRGLIQRAVDSWRNSNQDPRLRSRRVRRQAKMNNRSKLTTSTSGQAPGVAGQGSTGLPGPNSMPAPTTRPPGAMANAQAQLLHHPQDVSPTGHESVGAPTYNSAQQAYRQNTAPQHMTSPTDLRQSHVFAGYPSYATSLPPSMGPSMPPSLQPGLHHLGRPGGTAMASKEQDDKDEEDNALFGELPEGKRRKFILVEDTQKNARVRVKVTLDQIEMSEIPDSYRKQNSVFPRTYFPVQMQTAPEAIGGNRFVEEGDEVDGGVPTLGKTPVAVQSSDGEAEVYVPQISKSKRGREQKMNELGYRMAWGQGRVFSGRPIFLARALDAYRSKQRSALVAAGSEPSTIPSHLETRPGKRKWLERTRAASQPLTPPNATSE